MEKRWSERRAIYCDVKIVFNDRIYYARSSNIGLGGLFVDLKDILLPRHAILTIQIAQNFENREIQTFAVRVANASPAGYGLEFVGFNTGDFKRLQNLLYESTYEVA